MKILSIIGLLTLTLSFNVKAGLINTTILVDSSGSVYQGNYGNWYQELAAAQALATLHQGTSHDVNLSLVNYSGCRSEVTYEDCQHRLKLEAANIDNVAEFENTIAALDASDFNGGYTWTNSALRRALDNFLLYDENIDDERNVFVLFTDGASNPDSQKACDNNNGYVSSELQAIRDNNIDIMVVGVNMDAAAFDSISCLTTDENLFIADDFDSIMSPNFVTAYSNKYLTEAVNDIPEPTSASLIALSFLLFSIRSSKKHS